MVVSAEEYRRILGVPAHATAETIRQAYLDLARVWHPDRFHSDERLRKIAEKHLQDVNEAYAALRNHQPPESRKAEAPPPEQPASGPAFASASWAPHKFHRRGFLARVSQSISNKAAYTVMMTALLAVPVVAVTRLAGLLRIPSLDLNATSFRTLQPKILTPMRIIDPQTEVRAAADALTQWARGDVIDLWKSEGYRASDSPARDAPAGADVRKPAEHTPRDRATKHSTAGTAPQETPANGADLIQTAHQWGAGRLQVSNHTGLEAIVELVSGNHTRRAVYVAPDGSITLRSIPIGVYELHVELGTGLDARHLQFLSDRTTLTPLGPFQFLEISSDKGTSGNQYDVALHPR